ncbi:hypothetical protein AB0H73_10930 [Streptomyces olivoreticuli]
MTDADPGGTHRMAQNVQRPSSFRVAGHDVALTYSPMSKGRSLGRGTITGGLSVSEFAKWLGPRYNVTLPGELTSVTLQRLDVALVIDGTKWQLNFGVGVAFPLADISAQLMVTVRCEETGGTPVRQGKAHFTADARLLLEGEKKRRLELNGTVSHKAGAGLTLEVHWAGSQLTAADIGRALGVENLAKEIAGLMPKSEEGVTFRMSLLYTSKDQSLAVSATLAGVTLAAVSMKPQPRKAAARETAVNPPLVPVDCP